MRIQPIVIVVLVPIASALSELGEVRAQDPLLEPRSPTTIPLEYSAGPALGDDAPGLPGPRPKLPSIYPSRTPLDNYRLGDNAAVSRLRNPFEWGSRPDPRGSSGRASPQRPAAPSALPGVGPIPGPGAAPGVPPSGGLVPGAGAAPGGMPGAGAAPGAAPGAETAPSAPAAAGAAEAYAAATGAIAAGLGGGLAAPTSALPPMIGDASPFRFNSFPLRPSLTTVPPVPPPVSPPGPPTPPGPRGGAAFYPSVRNFKISENMSPRPQDRVFYDFNYYNNLDATINRRVLAPISDIKAYIHLFGLEKTFNDGKGSIGIRLPLDTVTADSPSRSILTPTQTALGNLSVFTKYILEQDPRTGSLVSVGLAVTPPTGPTRFAGAPYLLGINSVYFQPFLGYIYNSGRWYIQGFSGFDFPATQRDVTLMFNDIGIGYYAIRAQDPTRFLTGLAPTFELHVNTPFNHRDPFNKFDIAGSPDVVNLTYGLNFEFRRTAILTAALITPVSSPKPFDTEAVLLLNIFYGRTRASQIALTPPPAL
jgi:hypothetical protein